VLVLGATNRLDIVDPAILRPGRFDSLLELPMPDTASRLAILKIHMRDKPLAKRVSLQAMAAATEGCSGADLAAMCNKAALIAIREHLEIAEGKTRSYEGFMIGRKHMEQAQRMIQQQRA